MKPLQLEISLSVESCDKKKSAEIYRNGNVSEKHIVSKLSKISSQIRSGRDGSMLETFSNLRHEEDEGLSVRDRLYRNSIDTS